MSVINQMLRDLDKRRGRSAGEANGGEAVRSVQPESASRSKHRVALLIFGLALLMLAAGLWLRQRNNSVAAAEHLAMVVPAPVATVANDAPRAAALPVQPVAPITPVAPVTPVAQVAPPPAASIAKPEPAAVAKAAPHLPVATPRPPADSSQPTSRAPIATTPVKFVATVPAQAATSESAAPAPDRAEVSASTQTASASPKSAGGKTYSAEQLSSNLLAEASKLDQQGHLEEAKAPLERLLAANPRHVRARQMLAQLQLDTGHAEQARQLLAEGQRLLPDQSNFTLALARLQVDSGDVAGAIRLLESDPRGARDDPELHAFLAALLLRAGRTDEAVQHYLVALRSDPSNASWLVGAGVALEGVGNRADAAEAYRRAEGSASLTPELANFLSERLLQLRR